jgi:tRNA C32,U32 (ribose-2'-O)-methylase TrmJ
VTIPANPVYPILNISHAASIVFYELWKVGMPDHRRSGRTINRTEKEALLDHYERLLRVSNIPPHKIPISMINFRRMVTRASPNVREFYSLMGTFSRAMDYKRDRSPFTRIDDDSEE